MKRKVETGAKIEWLDKIIGSPLMCRTEVTMYYLVIVIIFHVHRDLGGSWTNNNEYNLTVSIFGNVASTNHNNNSAEVSAEARVFLKNLFI